MKRIIAMLALAAFSILLAEDRFNSYGVNYSGTYSAPDAITVQNSGAKLAQFQTLTAYCSTADCDIQVERDGTAASTTSQAVIAMAAGEPASTVVAFNQSNVGAGTVIYKFHVTAGGNGQTFDISALRLPAVQYGGVRSNVTFRITSTGVPAYRILPVWYEENL